MPGHLLDFSFQLQWNVKWINMAEYNIPTPLSFIWPIGEGMCLLGVTNRIEIWDQSPFGIHIFQ